MPKGSGNLYTTKNPDVSKTPNFGQPRGSARQGGKVNRQDGAAKRKY